MLLIQHAPPNTTIYHMDHQTPQCTTYTHMYHIYHNRYIYTTKHNYVLWKILCTTCTTMHHMHRPNITMHHIYIYLVGLPSTLYEIPCQCDRFDVKHLILRISHEICWISCEIRNEIRNVSFCVMIKYRSFEKRKTKYYTISKFWRHVINM